MSLRTRLFAVAVLVLFAVTTLGGAARATDGHFLHGVGAINSAMGGASVATSVDTLGAIFNNPATLSDLEPSRFDFSFEMFRPDRSVESSFGSASGETDSTSEIVPIPAFGLIERPNNGRVSYGLGILAIAGFGVDYHQDNDNPILAPPPNGFGHVFSSYQLMKISPSMAYAYSPSLSLGFALNLDWASLGIEPMPIASPDCSVNPTPPPPQLCFYPSASNQVGAYGAGFQVGVQLKVTDQVKTGLAYTSRQWFQEFEWNTVHADPNNLATYGQHRQVSFRLDVPQVIGLGVSWEPSSRLLLAADARWFNYANTPGFDEEGFNPDGSVKGFGWENIWAFGLGAQFRPTDGLALRAGYNYSQNPIPDDLSFFNVPAPAIVQHHLTAGVGFKLGERAELSLAYYHAFENSGDGPMHSPAGPVPGSEVKNSLSEDSGLVQVSYRF